jgi:hypothetical protein
MVVQKYKCSECDSVFENFLGPKDYAPGVIACCHDICPGIAYKFSEDSLRENSVVSELEGKFDGFSPEDINVRFIFED